MPCRGRPGWRSGDLPALLVEGEAEGEQAAQVEGGDAVLQPGVVLGHASVGDAAVPADEPGDAAFDHGPLFAVDLLEGRVLRTLAVLALEPFVAVQLDGAPPGAVVQRCRSGQP